MRVNAVTSELATMKCCCHSCYLALSLLAFYLIVMTSVTVAYPRCKPCNEAGGRDCDQPLKDCKFGIAFDPCQRPVCAKGPGERCGGRNMKHGECGSGMMCNPCGRCIGCSPILFQCYNEICFES